MSLNLGIIASSRTIASAVLPLDTYSSPSIAYSIRKLRTAYTGAAIRVRRSSDNTETDIGFNVGGGLDTTALTTFVGANNGFVTTWYDQGQYSKNWTQTTQANQPIIVNAGSIELVNSKVAIYFDGSNDSLSSTFTAITNTSSKMSIFQVFKINATSQFVVNTFNGSAYNLAGSSGSGGGTDQFSITPKYKNNTLITNTTQGNTWTNFNTNAQILCTQFSSTIVSTSGLGFSNFGGWPYKGWLQEEIYYLSDQLTNISGINSNINSYYSIY